MILNRNNRENKELITPTLCPIPWNVEYYESDGRKAMCCKSTSYIEGDAEWNGPQVRQVRKEMLEGKQPKACTMCFNEEKSAKGLSFRQEWVNMVDQRDPNFIKNVTTYTDEDGRYNQMPTTQQICLGNKCTNQCNMCSPWNSSAMNKVFKKIHAGLDMPYDKNWFDPQKYKWVGDDEYWIEKVYPKLHHTKALIITGGEPLIVKRFEQILEYCADNGLSKNMELHFNTNTAQIPTPYVYELIKSFKNVLILASIDDIKKRNEYIRYPTTWEQTQRFIEWGEATADHINLNIFATIQLLNIYHLTDIQDFWFKQNITKFNKNLGGFIMTNPCHLPEKFSTRILPTFLKQKVRRKFDNWKQNLNQNHLDSNTGEDPIITENRMWAFERLEHIITNMENNNTLSPHLNRSNKEFYDDFTRWTIMQDKIRGTDYTKVFPWLTMS